jgi:hypothetical protein
MRLSWVIDSAMLLFVRGLFAIAVAALLAGCDQRKPAMSDADFEAYKASYPGMTGQCLNAARYSGDWARPLDDPDCFEMMPEQRWIGLWAHGWEWSNFCPDPAKDCPASSEHDIELTGTKEIRSKLWVPWGPYRIEFIGRRTRIPGHFGNNGASEHMIVVDRVISINQIPGEKYTEMPGHS